MKKRGIKRASTVAKRIAKLLVEKKAKDVLILDLRKLTDICDFFVICTSSSTIHSQALANEVEDNFKKLWKFHHIEGFNPGTWILLDFYEVVVHIFTEQARKYYALEELWGDAKIVRF